MDIAKSKNTSVYKGFLQFGCFNFTGACTKLFAPVFLHLFGGDFMPDMLSRRVQITDSNGNIVSESNSRVLDRFDEEKGYLFWNKTSFVKTFQDVPLPKNITKTDIANLFLLSKKIYSNTNMIGKRSNGGIKPLSIPQMAEEIRDTSRHTVTFLNRMISARIIAKVNIHLGKDTVTQYYFNPIYFFSSNRLSLNLYLLFQQDLDPFLAQHIKKRFSEMKLAK